MADNTLDVSSSSFGIVDTISSSSQELIDSFLDGDNSVTANPDDIKDIKADEAKKPEPAKADAKAEPKKEEEEKPVPFDLDMLKDEDEEEEEEAPKPEPKKAKKSTAKEILEGKAPETTEEEETSPTSENYNPFAAFSKELYKLGVFEKGEDDEEVEIPDSPERFLETFNAQAGRKAETALQNFLSRFGEDYQQAFEAIFVNGVNPQEYFGTYNNIQSFAEMDLSSEENQMAIVRKTLKDLDYEDEDIKTEIERLKNYGDLETVAAKHHKVLVKKEAQKLQELSERQEQIRQQQLAVKRQFASSVAQTLEEKVKARDFDGIPINPKLAEEVEDMLLVEKWKNSSGEPLTDFDVEILSLKRPENHAMKVKVALLLKILKQDPTLSTIKKSAITKQTNQLFSEVVRNQSKTSVNPAKGSGLWNNL